MTENTKAEQAIRWVYHWLRWSVFITVPWMIVDLVIFESLFYPTTDWGYALAVLLPALAHVILFFGLGSPHLYARRHAQQALILVGLRALGGRLSIQSAPGEGTRVEAVVPIDGP